MRNSIIDQLTPGGLTFWGLASLALMIAAGLFSFGKTFGVGMGVGAAIAIINFKAISLIVERVLGPESVHKVLYWLFAFVKFLILAGVFFLIIYYRLFNVFGVVAGFSAALLVFLAEALIRAARYQNEGSKQEKQDGTPLDVSQFFG